MSARSIVTDLAPLIRACAASFALVILCVSTVWAEGKRAALLIGNSDYQHVSDLRNPANDAADLAAALKRIKFDVTLAQDLDYRGMRLALRDFAEKSADADVVMVYFAGHGIEIDNVNYLIPTNAELRSDRDVDFEAIRLDRVIATVADAPGLKIVLVDACRNNPFLSSITRTTATRSLGRGLARIDPGPVLVGYAARGGTLALDGDGRNSPYAEALLAHIEEPGLEIGKMFRKVRDAVYQITDGYQEPYTYGSLPGQDIFLVPAALSAPVPERVAAPSPRATPEPSAEATANADKLLKDALELDDTEIRLSVLSMLANLYPQTTSGRTARYMAEAIRREEAEAAERARQQAAARVTSPDAAPSGSIASDAEREAALNLSREDFRQMQRALNNLGYNVGVVDGVFGPRSRAGLRSFQASRGQDRTGYVTPETLAALRSTDLARSAQNNDATTTALKAPADYTGAFVIEVRRRPDPNGAEAGSSVKKLLRLEFLKSNGDFKFVQATDYSQGGGNRKRRYQGALTDNGRLSVSGSMNYLFNSTNMVPFRIQLDLPDPMPKSASIYSSHGRFDKNWFVDVKITRK